MIRPNVHALNAQRGALFNAAHELMRPDGDRSAAVAQLRDVFPGSTPSQIDVALREAAVQLVRV